jgi:hypothetical protein
MNWQNLMDAAKEQAGQTRNQPPGRPRQEPLKRAVSTAYYAMFHALCRSNADTLVGTPNNPLARVAWTRTYRALDHRQARDRLRQAQHGMPAQASRFAAEFGTAQDQRHAADYNPHSRFSRGEVLTLLDTVEAATEEYLQMPANDRRAVAALVLLQERNTG